MLIVAIIMYFTIAYHFDNDKKILNYDLVISFDDDKPLDTINSIKEETNSLIDGYHVIINYDQDFSLS